MESKITWKEPAKGEFPNEDDALIVLIKNKNDTEFVLADIVYYQNGEFKKDYIDGVDPDDGQFIYETELISDEYGTVIGWIYPYELTP